MSYICMIVDGAYPNDIRVRKEAEALAENGKKVLVVCPRKKNDLETEIVNNVTVFRIGKNYKTAKKGIYDILESVSNINPLFYFGIKKAFKKYKIDYLHVHDLPLAGTGFKFKNNVKKIYLDLHENYPEALRTWFLWKQNSVIKVKNSLFFNSENWSKKEEKYCQKYDKVICVVEEMKAKLIAKFNIEKDKLIVVSNHEKKSFADNFNEEVAQNIISKNDFSITYVGGFGPHRGLQTAIEAMPKIVQKVPNAKLFLIGKGSADVETKLRDIVKEFNVENSVVFVGYRPFKEVSTIMQKTNVNIIPHLSNDHTDNTIPHKLFQIMMSKSLLLVSSCKPLKRIVTKYNAGIVFNADDANDFAEKVISIHQNYDEYQIKTQNAFDAVMNKGENWEKESLKLFNLYTN
ncbi:glycosyltransferase family 4 protein [Polaribacter sp. Hel_I_88]|uniref:glycosyltransferase family 4 protein n=1 Tax=Polaribacter sp. Hel_I_88 TaxID=1250006 RepID=UPI0009DE5BEA|nr:glycosyltransferase family 4 protein [Polaribacter sp. Hel_I_88]